MATVSLCMIVKNEENVLARCLDSLDGLMDEIIIVDTGSTDRTKEIAARYTDQIYDFPWISDFSAARNFAASKATMEYIYTADADEVLDEQNRKRFADLKKVLLPEIEMVQMYYCNDLGDTNTTSNFEKELRPKLYRRLREFTWIDPVHETLRTDPVVFDSEIEIQHRPEGNHSSRDLSIFRNIQKNNPQGFRQIIESKKLHHMYAMELFISGTDQDFLEAQELFEESCRHVYPPGDDRLMEAVCVMVHVCRLNGDTAGLMKYALKGIVLGGCAEICCDLGEFYLAQNDLDEAEVWFINAATETESILNKAYHESAAGAGLERVRKLRGV